MEKGYEAYDLCIDDGQQVYQIVDQYDGWARVQAGTTVVMRIIAHQQVMSGELQLCPRPGCKAWNSGNPGCPSIDWYDYSNVIYTLCFVLNYLTAINVMQGFKYLGWVATLHPYHCL
jgi:hypothetical protein